MDEREVECSRCDNTTLIVQDDIQTGWMFIGEGWAAVGGMNFCPQCYERYLKHRIILGERERKYPTLILHPCE